MTGSERRPGRARRSEARSAARSSLYLSFALAGEHLCGPTGWPLHRSALRPSGTVGGDLLALLYADGWRSLDDLDDADGQVPDVELVIDPASSPRCSWCALLETEGSLRR